MPVVKSKSTGPWSGKGSGERRFWNYVNKDGPRHEILGTRCWIWMGCPQKGYGSLMVARTIYKAHRYSYLLNVGEIPDDMCVLHKCDNPMCVRPDHLFVGTPLDNVRDRDSKGRQYKGERHHCAKLTENDIKKIKSLHKFGKRGYGATAIARMFGVSKPVILGIIKGKGWKHVN